MEGLSLFLVLLNAMAAVGVVVAVSRDPALTFVCVGLVTVSWDRLSIIVGPMTLKPTYVAFGLAFVIDIVLLASRRAVDPSPRLSEVHRRSVAICQGTVVCLAFLTLSAVGNGFLAEGGRQLFVILVGAVVPGWVTYRVGRSPARRRVMIKWALIGAALTTVIALYQFIAVRFGLSTVFPYEGVAQGLGRTAGLSYEPAFLAMYLLSVTPLIVGRMVVTASPTLRRSQGALLLVILFGVLLSNSRAGYLVLVPAVAIPVAIGRPKHRAAVVRSIALVCVAVVILSVSTGFDVYTFSRDRLASIGDSKEEASNGPRLRLYATEVSMAQDHLWLGIGPGSLSQRLPEYGLPLSEYQIRPGRTVPGWRVVANNIWIQMMLDGGPAAVAGMVLILWALVGLARHSQDPDGRWIATGCVLVLLVGGMLTSIFWDVKIWALVGLCAGAAANRDLTSPHVRGGSRVLPAAASDSIESGVGAPRATTRQ